MISDDDVKILLWLESKMGKIRIALFWILLKFGLRNTTGLRK